MQPFLDLQTLARAYDRGSQTPLDVIDAVYARLARTPHGGVFIHEVPHLDARRAAKAVMERHERGEVMRLYGVPFAVKDNLDVAGMPTTAACPAFSHEAVRSATVVTKLLSEGAILIGKTNLAQVATGLVGTRTPYGVPENPFDARYVPGGSSSGSAVAVARGFCSFALGTDTAGSGRVPAAFNNVVGLKPTRGMVSAAGVVPACRSLDCVSVFALTVDDAAEVAHAITGFDADDPYARPEAREWDPRPGLAPPHLRFAVPRSDQLVLDDDEGRRLFEDAAHVLQSRGGRMREVDFTPFARAGALLYGGPWVAERLEAAGELLASAAGELNAVTRTVLEGAHRHRAADTFDALHELERLRAATEPAWRDVDVLVVPTAPGQYTLAQVEAEPLAWNARLGTYTNFVNLLDLCALAVPAGMRSDGLPFGVTLIAPRGRDALLASIGRVLHAELGRTLGATDQPMPAPSAVPVRQTGRALLAVVGAHLSGQPLNRQLSERGARLVRTARTAPNYRLYALPTTPPKPGMVRVGAGGEGRAIELEVYELSDEALGSFLRLVPGPLCIGTIALDDGAEVLGFLCESAATAGQRDISTYGGWRAFLASGQLAR
jgi:allophanate hydrolase